MLEKEKDILISLPVNRRQLFKFTFKTQWVMLIKLSLLLTLFALPLFLLMLVKGAVSNDILSSLNTGGDDLAILSNFLSQEIFLDLFFIPCFVILSIGFSGAYSLMKDYTFQEGFIFFKSFIKGIKKNGKEFIIITLFYSVIFYLLMFLKNYLSMINFNFYVPLSIFVVVMELLLINMAIFAFTQIPIYVNSIGKTIKNAYLFTFNKLFKISGIVCITFLPLLIVNLFQSNIATLIVYIIYIVLGFGYCVLVSTLYCQSVFDEIVNKDKYPFLYRKGLYNGEDDE